MEAFPNTCRARLLWASTKALQNILLDLVFHLLIDTSDARKDASTQQTMLYYLSHGILVHLMVRSPPNTAHAVLVLTWTAESR